MKTIVAVDKNWGIGKNNGLLFSLKKDMHFFRQTTTNKVVCMGYNTLLSFPGGKPLPNRTNIVLAPEGVKVADCTVVYTLKQLFEALECFDTNDVFIIGGAMFYRTMLDYCDTAYITKVEADGGAQVFFENLDQKSGWSLAEQSEPVTDENYTISFCVYKNALCKKIGE